MEECTVDLTREILNLFRNNCMSDQKWTLLKDYHTLNLTSYEITPSLLSNYLSITSVLIDSLIPTLFKNKTQEKIFEDIFLSGIHHEAFMILVRKLGSSSPSYQQQKILDLLRQFLKNHNMHQLILCQCLSSGKWDPQYLSASKMWNDLISLIVSLPERVANVTKGKMPKIFHTDCYIPLIISSVLKALTVLHEKIRDSIDCTLEFIGKLIGKLCVIGHGEIVAKNLYIPLIKLSESSPIWRRISQSLITKVPSASLEPFITHLFLVVPWYGYLEWILGDEGTKNEKIHFILSTKLLLFKHFKNVLILENIIGYYSSVESRRPQFLKICQSLIKTWADESMVIYQSKEQQMYLSSALCISATWMKTLKITKLKGLIDQVLQGVMHRIKNSEFFIRSLGMIVGELLVSALDPNAPKLENESIVDPDLLAEFQRLMIIPHDPGLDSLCDIGNADFFKETNLKTELKIDESAKGSTSVEAQIEKLTLNDDDDDLEPYDLSNDVQQSAAKRPFYLRDCLKGLIEQENADWYEQCLNHAVSLIEANADTVPEVAVEMSKILLHSEDKYATPDFLKLRHNIMVSLAVHSPILVSTYLTSQFYEDNYNIRQRLDILEVLSQASQELSNPKGSSVGPSPMPVKENFLAQTEKSWQVIVNERIAAKTRYITKKPQPAFPERENRFSDVAGHFFFPLLAKYDKKNKMLRLFGEDSYVLGRLVYTLGTIMYSALNIPMAESMGSVFFKFLADVRNHTDVFVRQACIFALAAVYTSVPGYLLFSSMTSEVMESQQWLQDIIDKDPDTNCQVRASYALSLIMRIMKEEMPIMSDLMIL